MTATIAGPYEHTGAYRPDVLAQLEHTEPQWSDAPAECEAPEPDLIRMQPHLSDQAWALMNDIQGDASDTHEGQALAFAALRLAIAVRDVPLQHLDDGFIRSLLTNDWYASRQAWKDLRELRITQLGGTKALAQYRQERS